MIERPEKCLDNHGSEKLNLFTGDESGRMMLTGSVETKEYVIFELTIDDRVPEKSKWIKLLLFSNILHQEKHYYTTDGCES